MVPAVRAARYFAASYRRTWRASVMTSVGNPVLYLLAMGVGLGSFVDKGGHTAALGHLSYLDYVAPALAIAAAVQTAAGESTWPIMGATKWNRTYYAMLATPLRVVDVMVGHLLWIAVRVAIAVTAYTAVAAAFGAVSSWEGVFVVPVGVLSGLAFAAPLAAFSVLQESDGPFSLVFRLGVVPLFLFSGVFFPLSQLPAALRVVAYCTPMWHGVDLARGLATGRATMGSSLVHLAYLAGVTAAGVVAARWTFRRRLLV